jgi:hypothetical protein
MDGKSPVLAPWSTKSYQDTMEKDLIKDINKFSFGWKSSASAKDKS